MVWGRANTIFCPLLAGSDMQYPTYRAAPHEVGLRRGFPKPPHSGAFHKSVWGLECENLSEGLPEHLEMMRTPFRPFNVLGDSAAGFWFEGRLHFA